MLDITITYNDILQLKELGDTSLYSPSFSFIDSLSKKGKKESWKIKNYWGAKLDPFIVIKDNGKPIKVFYSEAEDTIKSLIKYLNNMSKVTVSVINKSNNQLPKYETSGSAGFDIRIDFSRVTPENPIKVFGDAEVIFSGETHAKTMIRIEPMSRALLPTGIFTAIPEGWQVSFRPRSGMAIKKGLSLANTPSLIDSKL